MNIQTLFDQQPVIAGLLVFVIGGVFLSFVTKLIFICGKNITHSIKNITSRIKRDISPQVLSAQNESNTNNNSAINNSLNQTTSSLAKLKKGANITTDVLCKICKA